MVADSIATPICHIFNLSLEESLCPQAWRKAKVISLPKSGKVAFTDSNSRTISLLPALSKLLQKMWFDHIKCNFPANKLTTDFQHAYREGHSILTQMSDYWLKEIDKIVGAVLLDFSTAFDCIDHNLLLRKLMCYGFSTYAIL